ncbi:MAG: DNA recombination protein RmuC [Dehalococcoidia bacterium]|nr:DNA recombination protein RmuC [Dehalococcoidia bacterium]
MDVLTVIVSFFLGCALGGIVIWLILRNKAVALETRLKITEESKQGLIDTFEALAASSLKNNNEAFLQLATQALNTQLTEGEGKIEARKKAVDELIKPLSDRLKGIEDKQKEDIISIKTITETMVAAQQTLAKETRNLTMALRAPHVRGRWGETTLRRVVELTGMVEHCDFTEQESIETAEGWKRPDMVVHLPNNRDIVVDSKASIDSFLQAAAAETEDDQKSALRTHAKHIRDHYKKIAGKEYWQAIGTTPEFVVLFLPAESFLSAALQQDPALLEDAMRERVVLATPSSLFCLLHAVRHGWRQEQIEENAKRISELGREIYERLADWAGHLEKIGTSLDKAVDAYNAGMGSLERRVLVTARRFKDLGIASSKDIPETTTVNVICKASPELQVPQTPSAE